MSLFNIFEQQERELIVSLPYKVGLLIGRADDVKETSLDDDKERLHLEAVLQALGEESESVFVTQVVEQSLTYSHMWIEWEGEDEMLHEEIRTALVMIDGRLPKSDAMHYRRSLMRVGKVVAQAYGEHRGTLGEEVSEAFLVEIANKIMKKFRGPDIDKKMPQNISKAELQALKKLLEVLKG